ncbi:MAG: hypothetical protein SV765_03335 [Pseudomonadota bacterium]|nr:hypothetical protein [Pseudomonadota bacterium]
MENSTLVSSDGPTPVSRATRLLRRLRWLSPKEALDSAWSRDFGRSIEKSIGEIAAGGGVKLLKLRKRDAAVVMSLEHYQEVLAMKEVVGEMLSELKVQAVDRAADDFDDLYQQITASREGADSLFSSTPETLAANHQAGRTENS